MSAILVDTNILLYAHDPQDADKQRRAIDVLALLGDNRRGCLSVQNLSEFVSIATRGRRTLLDLEQAQERVHRLLETWTVFDLTGRIVGEAVLAARRYRMHYWDAQIWATARIHQLPTIFSEDFQDGARLEGVGFVNPFAPTFDLRAWQ